MHLRVPCYISTSSILLFQFQTIPHLELLPSTAQCKGLILISCGTVLQNRFSALSLAFRTDKLTLVSRHERQQRQRDQAEKNMAAEVTKLKAAVHVSMC